MKTKTAVKKKKPIHYGRELNKAIERKGLKKIKIAEQLGLSRVWLDELITTGKFTPDKLKIVKQIIKN